MRYEYKLIPAPERAEKVKGATAEARFAAAVERVLNDMAARGWEYQRTDTLPATERSGLAGGLTGASETVWRNLLVFRRPHAEDASAYQPKLLEAPDPSQTHDVPSEAPVSVAGAVAGAVAGDAPAPSPVADPEPAPVADPEPEPVARRRTKASAQSETPEDAPEDTPEDTTTPPPPKVMRQPVGPKDADELALRAALTGPHDDPPHDTPQTGKEN